MKHCHGCDTDKPLADFPRAKNRKDGRGSQCLKCGRRRQRDWYVRNKERKDGKNRDWYRANRERARNNHLLYKFGITLEKYNQLHDIQGGVCALCQQPESAKDGRSGKVRRLAVDHCHETGRVRGLLCYRCNHLIGCLGDNLEAALRLVTYMEGGGA